MKYLYLLVLALFFSCTSTKEDPVKKLKDETIAIHDEVMPKMGELIKTRKDLLAKADSLMDTNAERAVMLTTIADDIADANESMMDWMRNFEPEFEGSEEAIIQYFEAQKKSIQEVKENMLGSLEKGKEVLDQ